MITEEQTREILAGPRAEALVEAIDGAWTRYVAEGVVRPPRTRANVVWDWMAALADANLAHLPGVRRTEKHGSPLYIVDDTIFIRLKKHDRDLATRNVATEVQRGLAADGTFDDMPDYEQVSCGYKLDRAQAAIERVVAVRRVAGVVEWSIDLRELASGVVAPVAPILPGLPSELTTTLPRIVKKPVEGEGSEE